MELKFLDKYRKVLEDNKFYNSYGKVKEVIGLTIQVEGIKSFVGEVCKIILGNNEVVEAEVVGFKGDTALLMPLGELRGVNSGALVKTTGKSLSVKVGSELLGKIVDGLGNVIEGESLDLKDEYSIYNPPPNPLKRKRIKEIMPTGVKAIDGLITCGEGQRIGVFAGSGVGKSTLLGMMSRYCESDVNVIALIGERGREVLDFMENNLGEEGLKKSIVVCATSDQPALIRLKGAFVATAIAEYFRDCGKKVMLMMDSVTRFAMAQREVGLAIGEPPATKGYTPSVFAMLPQLLERSGTSEKGSITAFYTVLVEGDDMNEPIADSVRGILDGHIILSRKIAEKNHFPAIDVQQSISRLMKEIVSSEHYNAASELRNNLATYEKAEDLINLGAYKKGSNVLIDRAVNLNPQIDDFLKQSVEERIHYDKVVQNITKIFQ
ncbi:flagellar protein export ATPase FliI [Clostridium sediminicola]|uniref:flagellar protein export ATPase FliI n=1 Tax=Clostridium sediminicola TaxID=3114879 RepID=UPI0031F2090B